MKRKESTEHKSQLEMKTMFQKKSAQHGHGDVIYRSDSKEKISRESYGKSKS